MDINFKKFFHDMTTVEITFYLPTLRLHFLDGEVRDALPTHWHRSGRYSWSHYIKDGILLNCYPLTAIKEVEIFSVEEATITVYGDSIWVPLYAKAEDLAKKIYRNRKFGG
jgi:hypothetical protein